MYGRLGLNADLANSAHRLERVYDSLLLRGARHCTLFAQISQNSEDVQGQRDILRYRGNAKENDLELERGQGHQDFHVLCCFWHSYLYGIGISVLI